MDVPPLDPHFVKIKGRRGEYRCGLCEFEHTTVHHQKKATHRYATAAYWPVAYPDLKPNALYEITPHSPAEHCRIMAGFAQCWHAEFLWGRIFASASNCAQYLARFNFTQFKPIFYVDAERRPTAGFVFAIEQGKWAVCRIWVAPSFRHQGTLTRVWPAFQERFGDFGVIDPTHETKQFMDKIGCWEERPAAHYPIECEETA